MGKRNVKKDKIAREKIVNQQLVWVKRVGLISVQTLKHSTGLETSFEES